jgi:hypothetical protein
MFFTNLSHFLFDVDDREVTTGIQQLRFFAAVRAL